MGVCIWYLLCESFRNPLSLFILGVTCEVDTVNTALCGTADWLSAHSHTARESQNVSNTNTHVLNLYVTMRQRETFGKGKIIFPKTSTDYIFH